MNTRKKRSGQPERTQVPLLFNPDPGENLTAWMQKTFPTKPTMQPEDAIRLWLSDGTKNISGINAETPALPQESHPQEHSEEPGSGNGYRATVQQIAETVAAAVAAALYNEQPRRGPGHLLPTKLNQPSEPRQVQVHKSVDDSVERHDVGAPTLRAVQPDACPVVNTGEAGVIKSPDTSADPAAAKMQPDKTSAAKLDEEETEGLNVVPESPATDLKATAGAQSDLRAESIVPVVPNLDVTSEGPSNLKLGQSDEPHAESKSGSAHKPGSGSRQLDPAPILEETQIQGQFNTSTKADGVELKLPASLPTRPGVAQDTQSHQELDSRKDDDSGAGVKKEVDRTPRVDGLYVYDAEKDQTTSTRAPIDEVLTDSHISSAKGNSAGTPNQSGEVASAMQLVKRRWDVYKPDIYLGISIIAFLASLIWAGDLTATRQQVKRPRPVDRGNPNMRVRVKATPPLPPLPPHIEAARVTR